MLHTRRNHFWGRAVAPVSLAVFVTSSEAQTFFPTLDVDPVVGADRGSASRIRKLEEPTRYLTFSSTGSDVSGPYIFGFALGQPNIAIDGDQFDLTFVVAGPSATGTRELLAGGLGYRIALPGTGTTGYLTYDYGDLILGTEESLALDARGRRSQFVLGLRHDLDFGTMAKLRLDAQGIARDLDSEVLNTPLIAENLRILRFSMTYTDGAPFQHQKRVAASVSKGIAGLGASPADNRMASVPGARPDFLRVAVAGETSLPMSPSWAVNVGLIGQWTEDVLPTSQRCGYETNSYARAFDYALVTGDRCLAARVELANTFRADLSQDQQRIAQGFVGVDRGWLQNLSEVGPIPEQDTWSSLSFGIRILHGNLLGEAALTRIFDRPNIARGQSLDRLWVQFGHRF